MTPQDNYTAPITPEKKVAWNNFIDFLGKKGYKGRAELDDRNMKLGQGLMSQFNKENPKIPLTYADVSAIQSELQNYRTDLVKKWKSGAVEGTPDIKTENDIMPGISKIDGWLGSKTSSYKFPTAVVTDNGVKHDFGVQTDLYDQFMKTKKVADDKLKEK